MKTNKDTACAEIVESSLQIFTGQCWRWNSIPPFGSLVVVTEQSRTIFGIVYQIQTGSMDPMRYPFPYQKTHEELLAEQPQIFEFLKTTFSCVALGYKEQEKLTFLMPPEPPKIHSFIAPASPEQTKLFVAQNGYLPLLFQAQASLPSLDELLLAFLKKQSDLTLIKNDLFHEFITTYSLLIGNDYQRLKLFLSRAQLIL